MSRRKGWACSFLILAAGAAAYANSFSGAFHLDDSPHIVENARIRRLSRPDRIFSHTLRPVVDFTLAANYAAGRLDVRGYHAVNLGIHLLAALLLFGLLRRSFQTGWLALAEAPPLAAAAWLALAEAPPLAPARRREARYGTRAAELALGVTLLWTVHPLQTESVTYIIQRAESLMGLFYLLTLYGLARSAQSPSPGWPLLAVASCALGMGTKPVMVTAPLLALLYDRAFLAGSWKEAFRRRGKLHAGLCAAWVLLALLLAFTVSEYRGHAGVGLRRVTSLQYALAQPGVILHYLRLVFWPDPLILDLAWPVEQPLAHLLLPGLAIGALAGVTGWAWRCAPGAAFLGTAFFLILAPTSTFIPIADLAFEHRMYLPLAAVLCLFVLGLDRVLRRGALWAVLITLVFALGLRTLRRNEDYRDPLALWGSVLIHRPNSPRVQTGIGIALYRRGNLREAEGHFREAVRLDDSFPGAYDNLGLVLQREGRVEEACDQFARALRKKPKGAITHNNIGVLFFQQGQLEDAQAWFLRATELDPLYADAYGNLGAVRQVQGNIPEAIALYRRALGLDPRHTAVRENLQRAAGASGSATTRPGSAAGAGKK